MNLFSLIVKCIVQILIIFSQIGIAQSCVIFFHEPEVPEELVK